MAPLPPITGVAWRPPNLSQPLPTYSQISDTQLDIGDVDDHLPVEYGSHLADSANQDFQDVEDLLSQGNSAYRTCNYEEAISFYSKALHIQSTASALLLSNRSAAFCSLSQMLRKMPAAVSEEKSLYGLDPMSLVQLALKDAEKLLKLCSQWPKAYFRKGSALFMLEEYEEARQVFLSGLQIDPTSSHLQGGLRVVAAEDLINDKRKRDKVDRSDDLDCILCLKLLYNPITTPCGHSFCRACLLQAMDHGNKCPMCRTVLFVTPRTYPLSVTLNNIIQRNFPEEYAERKAEMDGISLAGEEILPLFVMDVVLPCEKIPLNIFEPRYRLMVRRIMEGNHRMGMVGIDHETGTLADVACEVEICECEPMHDGRFYLEVEGKRRCRITKTWEQDGYRVGQVQFLQDDVPAEGSQEKVQVYFRLGRRWIIGFPDSWVVCQDSAMAVVFLVNFCDRFRGVCLMFVVSLLTSLHSQMQSLAKAAAEIARSWMLRPREGARTDRRRGFSELMSQAAGMDAEKLSFWMANLLPLRETDKLRLLRMTDTRERLTQEMDILRTGHAQGCHVQ